MQSSDEQPAKTGKRIFPRQPNPLKITTMTRGFAKLADLITANVGIFNKEVLTSQEAAQYMGISLSTLYKLTMTAKVPHSKPGARCVILTG